MAFNYMVNISYDCILLANQMLNKPKPSTSCTNYFVSLLPGYIRMIKQSAVSTFHQSSVLLVNSKRMSQHSDHTHWWNETVSSHILRSFISVKLSVQGDASGLSKYHRKVLQTLGTEPSAAMVSCLISGGTLLFTGLACLCSRHSEKALPLLATRGTGRTFSPFSLSGLWRFILFLLNLPKVRCCQFSRFISLHFRRNN